MNTSEALDFLGAHAHLLTDEERDALDHQGFVILKDILTPHQVAALRERLDALLIEEGEHAGIEVHQESGTDRLANLVNKDPVFEVCFTHPRVLAAVAYVLEGDVQLSSLNSRAALPGKGHQGLHSDGQFDAESGEFDSCQTTWVIDAFTEENGPTRVVPGSHRDPRTPAEVLEDTVAPHSDEVHLIAPAGSVIVAAAHLWHSGTTNRSARPRRAIHAYFSRRHVAQQTRQSEYLRPETRARLSTAALHILNV